MNTLRDTTVPMIELPVKFKPHRQTSYRYVHRGGEEICIFEAEGPGCLRHFWLTTNTKGMGLRIRIHVDDTVSPQIDMELNHFFGVLLDKEPYRIESPGIKVLPFNAYNCYLPIPFTKSCRIFICPGDMSGKLDSLQQRFVDETPEVAQLFVQANWQEYESEEGLTPYRLFAHFHEERPARDQGTFNVVDISGVDGWPRSFRPAQPAWVGRSARRVSTLLFTMAKVCRRSDRSGSNRACLREQAGRCCILWARHSIGREGRHVRPSHRV